MKAPSQPLFKAALIALGVILFAITLIINVAARLIVRRSVRTWFPAWASPSASPRSATALYSNATSRPSICKGSRWKRGRWRSGLSLS